MLEPKEWTARMHKIKIAGEHTKTGYRRKKSSQEEIKRVL